jgi:hypothetical protein
MLKSSCIVDPHPFEVASDMKHTESERVGRGGDDLTAIHSYRGEANVAARQNYEEDEGGCDACK